VDGSGEIRRAVHPRGLGQHWLSAARIRRRASRGPCAGVPPRWRGPLESASDGGNHGYGCGAGCSAGTCACSRESSHNRTGDGSLRLRQRPSNGTGPVQTGQTGHRSERVLTVISAVQSTRRRPPIDIRNPLHSFKEIASVTARRLLLHRSVPSLSGACPTAIRSRIRQFPRSLHNCGQLCGWEARTTTATQRCRCLQGSSVS
jgi:hypothetical protein